MRCRPLPSLHRQTHSALPSHPGDPLGLTTSDAALLRGCPPGATRAQVHSATPAGLLARLCAC